MVVVVGVVVDLAAGASVSAGTSGVSGSWVKIVGCLEMSDLPSALGPEFWYSSKLRL